MAADKLFIPGHMNLALAMGLPLGKKSLTTSRILLFRPCEQICSGRFPCKAFPYKARTKLLKRWPALWPPTLATKSQKPRPKRWPLIDPSLPPCAALPTQPASGQRLVASLCAASKWPSARRRTLARLPQSKALSSNRRSCALERGTYLQLLALKSLQPWPQLRPNARSKLLQPSAPRRPQAEQLRARRPHAKPKRAQPFQSSAVKLWAQASAAATFMRQTLLQLNSLQLQRSASASD